MTTKPGLRRAARILVAFVLAGMLAIGGNAIAAQAASSSTRSVPAVVGWTASGAETALSAHGFNYTLKPPAGSKVKKPSRWTVTAQTPKGNSHARVGSKVTLTVVKTSVYLSRGERSFYAKDYGTFTTISQGGTGPATIDLPKAAKAVLVKATYTGDGKFQVVQLGKAGIATGRTSVSASGSYSGTVAVGLATVKIPTTELRVSGSGHWHITVLPIADAPIIRTPARDTGDHVYLYSGDAAIWTVSSPGPTTFMLNQTSSSSFPNLAVNESGNWAGKIALQPGPSVIEIHSNGTWAIS